MNQSVSKSPRHGVRALRARILGVAGAALLLAACGGKGGEGAEEPAMDPNAEMVGKDMGAMDESGKPMAAIDDIDMDGIVGEEVAYEADGITMQGYLAYDENADGKRPGVLVVHEWWGHNDYARQRARMLAKLGYIAFAVDMYGEGKNTEHPQEAGAFAMAAKSNIEGARVRFEKALEVLASNERTDVEDMAAIGYCFGGGVVLEMARMGVELDGVVSFHGSLDTDNPAQPGQVKASVLVLNGDNDPYVKPEVVSAFKEEMDAADVDYQFVGYDAVHSFTSPDADRYGEEHGLPLAYDEEVDRASWKAMQDFFNQIFAD